MKVKRMKVDESGRKILKDGGYYKVFKQENKCVSVAEIQVEFNADQGLPSVEEFNNAVNAEFSKDIYRGAIRLFKTKAGGIGVMPIICY